MTIAITWLEDAMGGRLQQTVVPMEEHFEEA